MMIASGTKTTYSLEETHQMYDKDKDLNLEESNLAIERPRIHAAIQLSKTFAAATKETFMPELGFSDFVINAALSANPIFGMLAPGALEHKERIVANVKSLLTGETDELLQEQSRLLEQQNELLQDQSDQIAVQAETLKSQEETIKDIDTLASETVNKLDELQNALENAEPLELDDKTLKEFKKQNETLVKKIEESKEATTKKLDELTENVKSDGSFLKSFKKVLMVGGLATAAGFGAKVLYNKFQKGKEEEVKEESKAEPKTEEVETTKTEKQEEQPQPETQAGFLATNFPFLLDLKQQLSNAQKTIVNYYKSLSEKFSESIKSKLEKIIPETIQDLAKRISKTISDGFETIKTNLVDLFKKVKGEKETEKPSKTEKVITEVSKEVVEKTKEQKEKEEESKSLVENVKNTALSVGEKIQTGFTSVLNKIKDQQQEGLHISPEDIKEISKAKEEEIPKAPYLSEEQKGILESISIGIDNLKNSLVSQLQELQNKFNQESLNKKLEELKQEFKKQYEKLPEDKRKSLEEKYQQLSKDITKYYQTTLEQITKFKGNIEKEIEKHPNIDKVYKDISSFIESTKKGTEEKFQEYKKVYQEEGLKELIGKLQEDTVSKFNEVTNQVKDYFSPVIETYKKGGFTLLFEEFTNKIQQSFLRLENKISELTNRISRRKEDTLYEKLDKIQKENSKISKNQQTLVNLTEAVKDGVENIQQDQVPEQQNKSLKLLENLKSKLTKENVEKYIEKSIPYMQLFGHEKTASITQATLQAKKGNLKGSLLSLLRLVPGVGTGLMFFEFYEQAKELKDLISSKRQENLSDKVEKVSKDIKEKFKDSKFNLNEYIENLRKIGEDQVANIILTSETFRKLSEDLKGKTKEEKEKLKEKLQEELESLKDKFQGTFSDFTAFQASIFSLIDDEITDLSDFVKHLINRYENFKLKGKKYKPGMEWSYEYPEFKEFTKKTFLDALFRVPQLKMAQGLKEGRLGKFAWGYVGSKLPWIYYPVEILSFGMSTLTRTLLNSPALIKDLTVSAISLSGQIVKAVNNVFLTSAKTIEKVLTKGTELSISVVKTTIKGATELVDGLFDLIKRGRKEKLQKIADKMFGDFSKGMQSLFSKGTFKIIADAFKHRFLASFKESYLKWKEYLTGKQEIIKEKTKEGKIITESVKKEKSLKERIQEAAEKRKVKGLTLKDVGKSIKTLGQTITYGLTGFEIFKPHVKTEEEKQTEILENIAKNTEEQLELEREKAKKEGRIEEEQLEEIRETAKNTKKFSSLFSKFWDFTKKLRVWEMMKWMFGLVSKPFKGAFEGAKTLFSGLGTGLFGWFLGRKGLPIPKPKPGLPTGGLPTGITGIAQGLLRFSPHIFLSLAATGGIKAIFEKSKEYWENKEFSLSDIFNPINWGKNIIHGIKFLPNLFKNTKETDELEEITNELNKKTKERQRQLIEKLSDEAKKLYLDTLEKSNHPDFVIVKLLTSHKLVRGEDGKLYLPSEMIDQKVEKVKIESRNVQEEHPEKEEVSEKLKNVKASVEEPFEKPEQFVTKVRELRAREEVKSKEEKPLVHIVKPKVEEITTKEKKQEIPVQVKTSFATFGLESGIQKLKDLKDKFKLTAKEYYQYLDRFRKGESIQNIENELKETKIGTGKEVLVPELPKPEKLTYGEVISEGLKQPELWKGLGLLAFLQGLPNTGLGGVLKAIGSPISPFATTLGTIGMIKGLVTPQEKYWNEKSKEGFSVFDILSPYRWALNTTEGIKFALNFKQERKELGELEKTIEDNIKKRQEIQAQLLEKLSDKAKKQLEPYFKNAISPDQIIVGALIRHELIRGDDGKFYLPEEAESLGVANVQPIQQTVIVHEKPEKEELYDIFRQFIKEQKENQKQMMEHTKQTTNQILQQSTSIVNNVSTVVQRSMGNSTPGDQIENSYRARRLYRSKF